MKSPRLEKRKLSGQPPPAKRERIQEPYTCSTNVILDAQDSARRQAYLARIVLPAPPVHNDQKNPLGKRHDLMRQMIDYFLLDFGTEENVENVNDMNVQVVGHMMVLLTLDNYFGVWIGREEQGRIVLGLNQNVEEVLLAAMGRFLVFALRKGVSAVVPLSNGLINDIEEATGLKIDMKKDTHDMEYQKELSDALEQLSHKESWPLVHSFIETSRPLNLSLLRPELTQNLKMSYIPSFGTEMDGNILASNLLLNIPSLKSLLRFKIESRSLTVNFDSDYSFFANQHLVTEVKKKEIVFKHLPVYEALLNHGIKNIFCTSKFEPSFYITLLKAGVYLDETSRDIMNRIVFESFGKDQIIELDLECAQIRSTAREFNAEMEQKNIIYHNFRHEMLRAFDHNLYWMLPLLPHCNNLGLISQRMVDRAMQDNDVTRSPFHLGPSPYLYPSIVHFNAKTSLSSLSRFKSIHFIDPEIPRLASNVEAIELIYFRAVQIAPLGVSRHGAILMITDPTIQRLIGNVFGLIAYFNCWHIIKMIKWEPLFIGLFSTRKHAYGLGFFEVFGSEMDVSSFMNQRIEPFAVISYARKYIKEAYKVEDVEFKIPFLFNGFPLRKAWLSFGMGLEPIIDRYSRLSSKLGLTDMLGYGMVHRADTIVKRYFQVFQNSNIKSVFVNETSLPVTKNIEIETVDDIKDFGNIIGTLLSIGEYSNVLSAKFYNDMFYFTDSGHTVHGQNLLRQLHIPIGPLVEPQPIYWFMRGIYDTVSATGGIFRYFGNDASMFLNRPEVDLAAIVPNNALEWFTVYSSWVQFSRIEITYERTELSYIECIKGSYDLIKCRVDPDMSNLDAFFERDEDYEDDEFIKNVKFVPIEKRIRLYFTLLEMLPPFTRDVDVYLDENCWTLSTYVEYSGMHEECDGQLEQAILQIFYLKPSRLIDYSFLEDVYSYYADRFDAFKFSPVTFFTVDELYYLLNGIDVAPEDRKKLKGTDIQIFYELEFNQFGRKKFETQIVNLEKILNTEEPEKITQFDFDQITIKVNQDSLIADSCAVINNLIEPFKYFAVYGENSYTAAGHFVQWLNSLSRKLIANYLPSIYPSDATLKDEKYLKCFGSVLALMMRLKLPFGFNVDRLFYDALFRGAEHEFTVADLDRIDHELANSLYAMTDKAVDYETFLQNPGTCSLMAELEGILDFTFTYQQGDKVSTFVFSQDELKVSNFDRYITHYVNYHLYHKAHRTFALMREGFIKFLTIIPSHPELANSESIRQLLFGKMTVDINDLYNSVQYPSTDPETGAPYDRNHENIRRFWTCVEGMTDEYRLKLFSFVTAMNSLPNIELSLHDKRIQVFHSREYFPKSFTCHWYLMLPVVEDGAEMCTRLMYAIDHGEFI